MEKAVIKALSMTNDSETLILVTPDHSNMFTYGHYGSFEESIFGTTKNTVVNDKKPILQIIYGSGPGHFYHRNTLDKSRRNLTGIDTERVNFPHVAGIGSWTGGHAGEDVALYPKGPWSHLFRGTEEQNYVAYVMMYASCVGAYAEPTESKNPWKNADWNKLAKGSIEKNKEISERAPTKRRAKNVILFLGDGMGVSTVSAARLYKVQSRNLKGTNIYLEWEKFPNLALIRTYTSDRMTADSASTATAYLCGMKANLRTIGVDREVELENCSKYKDHRLESIAHHSIKQNKWTGLVTTTRVTHASPAGVYASSPSRKWEDATSEECKDVVLDIAKQLILDDRNKDIRVILGGGAEKFLPMNESFDIFKNGGSRLDNANLIEKWEELKNRSIHNRKSKQHKCTPGIHKNHPEYRFVSTRDKLLGLNTNKVEYLLGLFNESHLAYEHERLQQASSEPSLAEMTEVAIKVLNKSKNGFFLFVEGGKIDHAHHRNQAHRALNETLAMEAAVIKALSMTNSNETLILVTADHSHMFTYGHYGSYDEPIYGTTRNAKQEDMKPTLQMFYGSGPGYMHHRNTTDNLRRDLTGVDTGDIEFYQDAGVYMKSGSHGGEDVALYATGPWSHLFRGTEEQNYVAHVMMYASCVGMYAVEEHCKH